MSNKPIIIVAGEPNSIFLEIFFKCLSNRYKSPLIIICSKNLLEAQMNKVSSCNFKINIIKKTFSEFKKLNNKQINLINVNYKFKNCFEKISSKSNKNIKKSFDNINIYSYKQTY